MSLIEATDKPLQSFRSGSCSSEEWTLLEPSQPPSPGTLQKMMRKSGNELKQQVVIGERYPKLGNTTQQPQSSGQRPVVSRYSSMYQVPRKPVYLPDLCKPIKNTVALHVTNGLSDPFEDEVDMKSPYLHTKAKASFESLTAAAAAVKKSATEAKANPDPRPTKASSLRARLSAGQLVKDEQTKILGFTDFTAPRASSESLADSNRRDSYRARKEAQVRCSNENLQPLLPPKESTPSIREKKSAQSLHSRKSTESLLKGRAPAQFVGGSRYPIPHSRPSSRGSNGNTPHGSISAPSSRPSSRRSQIPTLLPRNSIPTSDSANPTNRNKVRPRKTSLPVPTRVALSDIFKSKSETKSPNSSLVNVTTKKLPRNESSIYRDRSTAEFVSDLEVEAMSSFKNRGSAQIFKVAKDFKSLAAIEESPQHSFTTKRLSVKAPEYGPKLRISPSAERFIMGTHPPKHDDKENQPIPKTNSKSILQIASNGMYKQRSSFAAPASTFKQRHNRPLSSNGVLQSNPRHGLADPRAREKKAKSADMSSNILVKFDAMPNPSSQTSSQNIETSKGSKASSANELFFDAREDNPRSTDCCQETLSQHGLDQDILDEAAWIASKKGRTNKALIEPANTNLPSPIASERDDTQDTKAQLGRMSSGNPPAGLRMDADISTLPLMNKNSHDLKQETFAPSQTQSEPSPSSGRHSSRSSSRIPHRDFTTFSSCPAPIIPEKAPLTPPMDRERRQTIQNSLGSRHGHASSQIEIANLESKRVSSIRGSISHDPYGTNSPKTVSKKSFSGIRNLFNKRTALAESSKATINKQEYAKPLKTQRSPKTKAQHISITSTGSPFPPITAIHARHRPTLASSSRGASTSRNIHSTTTPASNPIVTSPALTTSPLTSPFPTSISTTTNLAMTLLQAARNERSSPQKERLLEMSKIMVDAITQARDAEKAAEEAKMASRRAEMSKEICARMVEEVGRVVGEWKVAAQGDGGL